jgi:hypothetical protein
MEESDGPSPTAMAHVSMSWSIEFKKSSQRPSSDSLVLRYAREPWAENTLNIPVNTVEVVALAQLDLASFNSKGQFNVNVVNRVHREAAENDAARGRLS